MVLQDIGTYLVRVTCNNCGTMYKESIVRGMLIKEKHCANCFCKTLRLQFEEEGE